MKTLLNEFRNKILNQILDLLWIQWTTLGVSGRSVNWVSSPIDPEALLLFSATAARYDARLFDTILDWITQNQRFINVARLHRIGKTEVFTGRQAIKAMISTAGTSNAGLKWDRILKLKSPDSSEPESFFFDLTGNAIPVVGQPDPRFLREGFLREEYESKEVTDAFNPDLPGNLILKLRAFFGVNARCEIIQFLLMNPSGSPRALARDCYYLPGTIIKAMSEMEQSGILRSRIDGRRRRYEFNKVKDWQSLFIGDGTPLNWIVWPCVFSVLDQVIIFLESHRETNKTDLELASSLRRIVAKGVEKQLIRSGFPDVPELTKKHPGTDLVPVFIDTISRMLDWVVVATQPEL
jgi:hypothetical protein